MRSALTRRRSWPRSGNRSVEENSLLGFTVSATDPDGDDLSYSAAGLPTGATFVGADFSWTPTYDQKGSYTVTFTVSDGTLQDSETIGIAVGNVNQAPELEAIGNQSVDENSLLSFTVSATDPDGDDLSYSAAGLPTGATFSGQVFSWKPTYDQKGSYTVTFTVSDGTLQDSETIGIAVGQRQSGAGTGGDRQPERGRKQPAELHSQRDGPGRGTI